MPFRSKAQQNGLPPQVGGGSLCGFAVVGPQSDDAVAGITQKSSDSSGLMAMVNTNLLHEALANWASTFLRLQERIKLALCDPIPLKAVISRLPIFSPPAGLTIPGITVEVLQTSADPAMPNFFGLYEWEPCQRTAFRTWLASSRFAAFGFVETLNRLIYLALRTDHKVLYHAVC